MSTKVRKKGESKKKGQALYLPLGRTNVKQGTGDYYRLFFQPRQKKPTKKGGRNARTDGIGWTCDSPAKRRISGGTFGDRGGGQGATSARENAWKGWPKPNEKGGASGRTEPDKILKKPYTLKEPRKKVS